MHRAVLLPGNIYRRVIEAAPVCDVIIYYHSFEVLGCFPFDQKSRNFRSGDKWNGNFQEKIFANLGIAHEVVLFFGNYAYSQFSIQR